MKDEKLKYQNIGGHVAPTKQDVEDGEALLFSDVSDFYPDIYDMSPEQAERMYPGSSAEEYEQLIAAKNNPEAEIKIYRATPPTTQEINPGDWVTTSKEYAQEHGNDNLKGGYHVLETTVKAGELATEGNSVAEWSYVGDESLTPKLDLFEEMTDILVDEDFISGVREAVLDSDDGINIEEHMREALSEELGVEIDEDMALDYAYHIESEGLAKRIMDPQADVSREVKAANGAIAMLGSEAHITEHPEIIEDMAEAKVEARDPEFANEFINRENVGAVVNACDKLDKESLGRGENDITDMSMSDAIEYCQNELPDQEFTASENTAIMDSAEDIARFYRANWEEGAGDKAQAVWTDKLEKVEEAKGVYEDALIELDETIEQGGTISDDLKKRVKTSGELLLDHDMEAFNDIHERVHHTKDLGSGLRSSSPEDITKRQYAEIQRTTEGDMDQEQEPEVSKTEEASKSQSAGGVSQAV